MSGLISLRFSILAQNGSVWSEFEILETQEDYTSTINNICFTICKKPSQVRLHKLLDIIGCKPESEHKDRNLTSLTCIITTYTL